MARLFDDASSEYLSVDQIIHVTFPFVMACWAYHDSVTTNQWVMYQGGTVAGEDYVGLHMRGTQGDYVRCMHYAGGATRYSDTSTAATVNTWHHEAAAVATTTDRRSWIDGGSKGTNTTSEPALSDLDGSSIGTLLRDPQSHMSGRICEAAVWDVSVYTGATDALKMTDWETRVLPGLAAGFSPLCFTLGLVAYYPLGGPYSEDDDDTDIVGGKNMTATGTPTTADQARQIYPVQPMVA